ncbi:MAG TPA: sigma-54 dependent transcriptional regulator [Candidatus Binatia bacterium]|nr:sigma-54 dependent transcriptional regulator [Candidatus Binatia bacterium]
MPGILIVDDEANIRSSLEGALGREGYQVEGAATVAEARAKLRDSFDFILLDVWLPDGNGLDLLRESLAADPDAVVIMMSGHATIDAAVQATRLGAFDFLEKPLSLERLLVLLRNAGAAAALKSENRRLTRGWATPITGRSPAIRRLLGEIERAGAGAARVLIQGENGTGKELVARALHAAGPREGRPFVAVNCAAIPEELIESELFGHERGAFTGATQARKGRFEEAHGGALFLDEVGDLSARAQTKLLRVLQEGELTRVGGNRAIRVDVRVIAATNQDLAALVRAGRFREDLYFRLAVIPITVPPLRERAEDIPLLVERFVVETAAEAGVRPRAFAPAALETLARYRFPGNVRELRNIVERLLIMAPGERVGVEAVRSILPPEPAEHGASDSPGVGRLADRVRDFERSAIEAALAAEGGSMTRAAARLGLERSHLYKKMKKLGWTPDEDAR